MLAVGQATVQRVSWHRKAPIFGPINAVLCIALEKVEGKMEDDEEVVMPLAVDTPAVAPRDVFHRYLTKESARH